MPGDFGSGNSMSSNVGVSTLGASSRTATAIGCCNSSGRGEGTDSSSIVAAEAAVAEDAVGLRLRGTL